LDIERPRSARVNEAHPTSMIGTLIDVRRLT
jgi:hypothetical protein